MTQKELQIEYCNNEDSFDTIKKQIESDIVRVENYRGEFYEIFPFSYQRKGFKQGKIIENLNRIKSTNGLYTYGFNDKNKIIEIREGLDLKNEFYYQFLLYEKDYIKSFSFKNDKTLQNLRFYFFNKDGNVLTMYSKGKRGGREEHYQYREDGTLISILIKQFDKQEKEQDSLLHSFKYNTDGSLKSIVESSFDNEYSEVIWK